ncbi:hypothetical protein DFJ73DRAFT_844631 [Zopfochytrium polystomum]|nr:hypothetical protein DFJ73DRAFT_844631 [Zopfochytrium polystomum]
MDRMAKIPREGEVGDSPNEKRRWGAPSPRFRVLSLGVADSLRTGLHARLVSTANRIGLRAGSAIRSFSLLKGSLAAITGFSSASSDEDLPQGQSPGRATSHPSSGSLLPPLVYRDPRWLIVISFICIALATIASTMILVNDGIVASYFVPQPRRPPAQRRGRRRLQRQLQTLSSASYVGEPPTWVGRIGSRQWQLPLPIRRSLSFARIDQQMPSQQHVSSPTSGPASFGEQPPPSSLNHDGQVLIHTASSREERFPASPLFHSSASSPASPLMAFPNSPSTFGLLRPETSPASRMQNSYLSTSVHTARFLQSLPSTEVSPTWNSRSIFAPQHDALSTSAPVDDDRIAEFWLPESAVGLGDSEAGIGRRVEPTQPSQSGAGPIFELASPVWRDTNLRSPMSNIYEPIRTEQRLNQHAFDEEIEEDETSILLRGLGLVGVDGALSPRLLTRGGYDEEGLSDDDAQDDEDEYADLAPLIDSDGRGEVAFELEDTRLLPSSDWLLREIDHGQDGTADYSGAGDGRSSPRESESEESSEPDDDQPGRNQGQQTGVELYMDGWWRWRRPSNASASLRQRRRRMERADSSTVVSPEASSQTDSPRNRRTWRRWAPEAPRIRRLRDSVPGTLAAVGAVILLGVLWFLRRRGWSLLPRLWQLAARRWNAD